MREGGREWEVKVLIQRIGRRFFLVVLRNNLHESCFQIETRRGDKFDQDMITRRIE